MGAPAPLDPNLLAAAAMRMLMEDPLFKVGEAEIRGNIYRVFENAPQNLREFFAYGSRHGEKEFLCYEGERLTFGETWRRACRFANALQSEVGVKQGDQVAIAMRNFPNGALLIWRLFRSALWSCRLMPGGKPMS